MPVIHNEIAALNKAEQDMQRRVHSDRAAAANREDEAAVKIADENRETLRRIRAEIGKLIPQHCPDLSAGSDDE